MWLDGFQGRGLAVNKILDGYRSAADFPSSMFYRVRHYFELRIKPYLYFDERRFHGAAGERTQNKVKSDRVNHVRVDYPKMVCVADHAASRTCAAGVDLFCHLAQQ